MPFPKTFTVLLSLGALTLAAPAFAQDASEQDAQPMAPAPGVLPPSPDQIPSPEGYAAQDTSQPPADDWQTEPEQETQPYDEPSYPDQQQAYPDESQSYPDQTQTYPTAQAPAPQWSAPAPSTATSSGQWVYTSQYGWVWMPYGQAYSYVVPGGNPYMFVFRVGLGWNWVVAPWVYGWGPRPYWGSYGPRHFAWYRHPWFTVPRYRRVYRSPVYRGPSYGYRSYGYRSYDHAGPRGGGYIHSGPRAGGFGHRSGGPVHRGTPIRSGGGHRGPSRGGFHGVHHGR